ncbi:MAG: UxaA family hydrolase [Actinobacteria bacterium]|nr:UxaA family hydrolase [Actinomycetota bacterium]
MANRPTFLAHHDGDYVAVAVMDAPKGPGRVEFLDGSGALEIDATAEIPLGHKVALRDVAKGEDVIEYGVRTAIASADIEKGDYVHIHNVRSARWHNSVA